MTRQTRSQVAHELYVAYAGPLSAEATPFRRLPEGAKARWRDVADRAKGLFAGSAAAISTQHPEGTPLCAACGREMWRDKACVCGGGRS